MQSKIFNAALPTLQRLWLMVILGVLLAFLLPTGAALAAPVTPGEIHFTQPDGTVIVVVPFGDEWYSGYQHLGYTILLDRSSNYWVYAEQGIDGYLVPGQRKAGIDPVPGGLPRSLRNSQAASPDQALAAAQIGPKAWGGASGTQKLLVILVDFTPSTSRGTTEAAWNQAFFDTTPGAKSVANYYTQASFSNFALTPVSETYGTANDGVVAVTLSYAHPNSYPTDINNRQITLNALLAADAYVNFGALDTNANGSLDSTELHLFIIVRGFEKSYGGVSGSCGPSVWGHRGSLSLTEPGASAPVLDGVTVAASSYSGGYTQEGEWHEFLTGSCGSSPTGHMATTGIMIHELGHDINWPDLYDIDNSSQGVGDWSIMSGGSWGYAAGDLYPGTTPVLPDAFLKWYQHWITPVQMTVPQNSVVIPNSAQNPVAYLIGTNPEGIDWQFGKSSGTGEYFLIENRQQIGYDAGLVSIDPAAKGCLIWHIDETRLSTNYANATEARKLVDVVEAHGGPQDLDFATGGNSGDAGDPWPGSGSKTTFSSASDPNSNWYDGTTSGITVSNISTAGGGCTVDFTAVGPTWNGSASTDWNNVNNWSIARVPTVSDNVVIPSGVSNWPNLNAAGTAFNVNILNGAHVTADANVSLDVYGDWNETGSGDFKASAGTVTFRGSSAQAVTTNSASYFNHLAVGTGSTTQTVTAGSDLHVNGNLTINAGANLTAGSHTLRVAGNWSDSREGFVQGTSTVILDGASQALIKPSSELPVYSNDFSSQTGFLTSITSGSATWGFTLSTIAPNGGAPTNLHARSWLDTTAPSDDWLFTPGFTLKAGVTYTIRFKYGTSNAAKPEKMRVRIGTGQSAGSMTATLFDNTSITNTTWQVGSGSFTPGVTGTYYIGFYCYSPANSAYPAVDDLEVVAPDLYFNNLQIAAGSTASLSNSAALQGNLSVAAGGSLTLGTNALSVEGSVTNNGLLSQTKTVNAASTVFLNLKNSAATLDKYWGATIDPGAGNLGSTVVTVRGNQFCSGSTAGVLRCFDIAPTSALPAAVKFYYTEAERNSITNNTMRVFHWNGSAWDLQAGTLTTGGSGDAQWAQVTGIAAYSPFALNHNSPTAVTLTRFEGQAALSWWARLFSWLVPNQAVLP